MILGDDGTFEATLGEVTVDGQANQITFSDIAADIVLEGCVRSADAWCGTVDGEASQPIALLLQPGSTFAALRAEPGDFVSITDPPIECPE